MEGHSSIGSGEEREREREREREKCVCVCVCEWMMSVLAMVVLHGVVQTRSLGEAAVLSIERYAERFWDK